MNSATPDSPKRRHILSSINPQDSSTTQSESRPRRRRHSSESRSPSGTQRRHRDRNVDRDKNDDIDPEKRVHEDGNDKTKPRRSRLKLKSDGSRHKSSDGHSSSSRRHRHRHRHRGRSRSPSPPNPHEPPPLDPEEAFRQSLFDAMADDEGAAYWEGVYGQPVHTYANEKVGPQGELERMTDEEYAAHVRQKMWEKTNAGLLEEKARREEEKKKRQAEERHSRKLREEMEKSLRRGEERRQMKQWTQRWEDYIKAWTTWDGTPETIAWPLEHGKNGEINEQLVRAFFIHGLGLENLGEQAFIAKLKDERVRWHPDKVQQRLGGKVNDEIMRDVTAIFQIIDRLWSDMRSKAK